MRYLKLSQLSCCVVGAVLSTRACAQSFPGAHVEVFGTIIDPVWMTIAPDGSIFCGRDSVVGFGGDAHRLQRIPPSGGTAIDYSTDEITDPDAVLFDTTGSISGVPGALLVGIGSDSRSIIAIRPDGSQFTVASRGLIQNPCDFALDLQGRLVFLNDASHTILRYSRAHGFQQIGSVSAAKGIGIFGLAINELGDMFIGTSAGDVLKYSASGALVDGNYGHMTDEIVAVGIGRGGAWGKDLYVAGFKSGDIRRYSAPGTFTTVGTGFQGAIDIAFDANGAMFLSVREGVNQGGGKVLKVICDSLVLDRPQDARTCVGGGVQLTVVASAGSATEIGWQWRHGSADAWHEVRNGPNFDPVTSLLAFDAFDELTPNLRVTGLAKPGIGPYQFRAMGQTICATAVSDAATVLVCDADRNCDGTVTLEDFFAFFQCFDGTLECADIDGNNSVDLEDFFAFFDAFDVGC